MKRKLASVFSVRKSSSANDVTAGERSNIYSCYKGGTEGICAVCSNTKINCNCQHCRGCGSFLMAMRSRHHCRMCWRPFCNRCGRKQRVVEFMGGSRPQPARTCLTCAVPHGLLHVWGAFDTYGTLRGEGVASPEAANASFDAPAEEGDRFRWGLYALLCVIDAPRRCINPSCSVELMYADVCAKCKLPTVASALHEVRSVPSIAGSGSNKVDTSIVQATEDGVAREHNAKVDSLAANDVDALYLTCLPNHADSFALHGMRDDTWAAHKVLLSRIAASIAGEGQNCPNISLAMCDTPEATLLRIVRVEPLYTIFESPGMVRYVAFGPTKSRKALDRRLASTVHNRQVWSTNNQKHIGIIAADERGARQQGGVSIVGEFGANEALLRELEDGRVYDDLTNDILAMMQEGADIVLCGFSTGGGLASLMTAHLLIMYTDITCDRLLCVTFGAPLVANRGLTEVLQSCQRKNLCNNFQHFVNGSDVIPRLSFLSTFLAAGTLGAGAGSADGASDSDANIGEVRDVILTWLCANQAFTGIGTAAAAATNPSPKSKKDRKLLAKEKRTATSLLDVSSSGAANGSTNTYYENRSTVSSDVDVDDAVERGNSPRMASGDIFARSREPFDNNRDAMLTTVSESGEVTSPTLAQLDVSAFETEEYRNLQVLEPFGCYNILWRGPDMYTYSDDPGKTLALLSDRRSMRVLLQDHRMASYDKAIFNYMNAAA